MKIKKIARKLLKTQMEGLTNTQTDIPKTDRQKDRQIERQKDRQKDRWTDRQTSFYFVL